MGLVPAERLLVSGSRQVPLGELPVLALREVRRFGALDGPLAFSRLGDVAVGPDGILAAIDQDVCQVVRLELASGKFIDRIGRCGDGPGELRDPQALAFASDTLVVLDGGQRAINFFDRSGAYVRRYGPAFFSEVDRLSDLVLVDSVTAAISVDRSPLGGRPSGEGERMVAILDLRSGEVRAWRFQDPVISRRNGLNALRGLLICAPGSGGRLATMNRWALEGVTLSSLDATPSSVTVPLPWHRPLSQELGFPSGSYLPSPGAQSSLACGDSLALFKVNRPEYGSGGVSWKGGALLAVDYDGRPVGALRFDAPPDSSLMSQLRAATGRDFFAVSKSLLGFPMIQQLELVGSR